MFEGRTPLAEQAGFSFDSGTFPAKQVRDLLMPEVPIEWSAVAEVQRFVPPPISAPLVVEADSERPLAVASRVGEGVVIYLATELDPVTGLGYTRFPFLAQHLRQRFNLEPLVSADGVEFYFDPGFRENIPVEELVKAWHNEGVRAIYAAAWHAYPKWTYDYDLLIRLCHAQGIAVYAWIEFPEVSQKFWEEHPEWRDKTATGRDAIIGWRKFMNLANPDCRAAALRFLDELLSRHDWDGVNIAELCFDTDDGLLKPDGYIPMNAEVCRQFQEQGGFDPHLLFDEASTNFWKKNPAALARWTAFRCGLTRDWLAEVLGIIRGRPLDVIVTALDSFSVPRVIERTGCDSRDVVGLMDRFDFTLQVEDPEEMWGAAPTRYLQFGDVYRKLVKDPSRLMFDINVVKDREQGNAPTELPCGLELALTAQAAAAAGNGRVGLYSEASVLLQDRELLPFIMGSAARVNSGSNGVTVSAGRPVRLQFERPQEPSRWSELFGRSRASKKPLVPIVDGQPWIFGGNGTALLEPGEHRFTGLETPSMKRPVWIHDMTAPFTSAAPTRFGLGLDYTSPRRAWLTISREPSVVLSDGQPLTGAVARSGYDWIITLPAGQHRFEFREATTIAKVVEETGEEALSSIAWIGTRGLVFVLGLYGMSRLRRLGIRFQRRAKTSV